MGNNTSEENKTFAMSFLNTESPQNETSHELSNPVYHSISQFPHAFIRLGKIVQEISPILYPQDSNGKRGEGLLFLLCGSLEIDGEKQILGGVRGRPA